MICRWLTGLSRSEIQRMKMDARSLSVELNTTKARVASLERQQRLVAERYQEMREIWQRTDEWGD